MNHSQAQRYLPFLINEGYLTRKQQSNGVDTYEISDKGKKLLQLLSQLTDLLDVVPGESMSGLGIGLPAETSSSKRGHN